MSWIDPRQWVLVFLFCAASVIGVNFWKERLIEQGDHQGYQRATAEQTNRSLRESEARRKKEAELQAAKQKAEEQYEAEKRRRIASSAAAQSELGRLRSVLEARAAERGAGDAPTKSQPGADGATGVEELFGRCATRVVDLAGVADQLSAQVIGLQLYVTNVCLTQSE